MKCDINLIAVSVCCCGFLESDCPFKEFGICPDKTEINLNNRT